MSSISQETASPFTIPTQTRFENPEIITVHSFIVKPVGTGTQKTLVESDSLSSFSLPEETSNRKVIGGTPGNGATRDGSIDDLPDQPVHHRRGQSVIDIDNLDDHPEPTRIEMYLQFMYNVCASPYNPVKREDGNAGKGSRSIFDKILDIVHKGCFAIFATLSVLQAIFKVKLNFLINLTEGGLENFTNLAYFIMNACTKIYFVYVLVQQQTKMTRIIDSFLKLRKFTRKNAKGYKNSRTSFPSRLGVVTVIVSLIQTLFVEWKPKPSILHHSFFMSANMYLWKPESFDETADSLLEQYGEDLTTTNILLGICGAVMNYCSNTHLDVAGDLMLVTAETLKEEIGLLEGMVREEGESIGNVTLEQFLSENGLWAHYRVLKQAVCDTNEAFDSLLKYMHVDNMMRFVYFVMNVFDRDFTFISSLGLVYTIVKTSYTYRCATAASRFNDSGRNWVRQLAMESKDKMFLEKAAFIMDELEKQPLGLGTGQFLINESFLFRFLGSVGSVFVLQAQSREGSMSTSDEAG